MQKNVLIEWAQTKMRWEKKLYMCAYELVDGRVSKENCEYVSTGILVVEVGYRNYYFFLYKIVHFLKY